MLLPGRCIIDRFTFMNSFIHSFNKTWNGATKTIHYINWTNCTTEHGEKGSCTEQTHCTWATNSCHLIPPQVENLTEEQKNGKCLFLLPLYVFIVTSYSPLSLVITVKFLQVLTQVNTLFAIVPSVFFSARICSKYMFALNCFSNISLFILITLTPVFVCALLPSTDPMMLALSLHSWKMSEAMTYTRHK